MGKGSRSKTKKRLNSAKREHYMKGIHYFAIIFIVIGNAELEELAKRQADPIYSAKFHKPAPPNAFIEPNNPQAVVPQRIRQKYTDYRSNAVEGAKTAMPGNFRNKEPSKYITKVWTAEELKEEEMNEVTKLMQDKLDTGKVPEMNIQDEEIDMDKMNLSKKIEDVDDENKMDDMPERRMPIRKNKKGKKKKFKSYKIVNF